MAAKRRTIEVDPETADVLEARAAAKGMSVSQLVANLARTEEEWPGMFEAMRAAGRGPWAPQILAEDARRLAEFERNGEGVPWDEVKAWMQSWGTPGELPPPRPRK